jgi:hypothetical protein
MKFLSFFPKLNFGFYHNFNHNNSSPLENFFKPKFKKIKKKFRLFNTRPISGLNSVSDELIYNYNKNFYS